MEKLQVHLPRWEELPNLDLYLDQVVTVMEEYLEYFVTDKEDKIITDFAKILNYLDGSNIKKLCGDIALEVVKLGAFYGYLIEGKNEFFNINQSPEGISGALFSIGKTMILNGIQKNIDTIRFIFLPIA